MSEEYKVARIYKSGKFECCEGVEYDSVITPMTAQEFGETWFNILTNQNLEGKINILAENGLTPNGSVTPIDIRESGMIVEIYLSYPSKYIKVEFQSNNAGELIPVYTFNNLTDLITSDGVLVGSVEHIIIKADGIVDKLNSLGNIYLVCCNGKATGGTATYIQLTEEASYAVSGIYESSEPPFNINNVASFKDNKHPYISHQGISSLSEIIESDASSVSLSKSGILTCNEFVESGELIELYRQGFLGKVDRYTSGDPVVFNNGYKIECFEQNNLDISTSIMKAGQSSSDYLRIKLNISGGNILTLAGRANSIRFTSVTDISLTSDNSPVSIDSVYIKSGSGGSSAGGSTTTTYLCTIKVTDPEGNFAYYNNTSDSLNLYTPISDVVYLPSKYRIQNALT